jgi:hypothetical protein
MGWRFRSDTKPTQSRVSCPVPQGQPRRPGSAVSGRHWLRDQADRFDGVDRGGAVDGRPALDASHVRVVPLVATASAAFAGAGGPRTPYGEPCTEWSSRGSRRSRVAEPLSLAPLRALGHSVGSPGHWSTVQPRLRSSESVALWPGPKRRRRGRILTAMALDALAAVGPQSRLVSGIE